MSHVPHELSDEFPEHRDRIHDMKQADAHFARLVDDYHKVNREVHQAETNVAPTDDLHAVELRKERLRLKDEIWRLMQVEQ